LTKLEKEFLQCVLETSAKALIFCVERNYWYSELGLALACREISTLVPPKANKANNLGATKTILFPSSKCTPGPKENRINLKRCY